MSQTEELDITEHVEFLDFIIYGTLVYDIFIHSKKKYIYIFNECFLLNVYLELNRYDFRYSNIYILLL